MKMKNQEIEEIINLITELCDVYEFIIESASENQVKIFRDHTTGLYINIEIESSTKFNYYFIQRTYDVVYNGDRTDVHVVLSLVFSSFLRLFDTSMTCSLFDIPHPVVEDEIWGRYIIPVQNDLGQNISSTTVLKERIAKLIESMAFWRALLWSRNLCPCKECMSKLEVDNNKLEKEVDELLERTIRNHSTRVIGMNYGGRHAPEFKYVYDIKNEFTVIESSDLSNLIQLLIDNRIPKITSIDGINGQLFLDQELKNYCSYKSINNLKRRVKKLFGTEKEFVFYPMENMIIAHVPPYIIGLGRLGGIEEFKKERELLRERHNKEAEILFPITQFEWNPNVCPDQFEQMIKMLLERESGVKEVRRPAPINQGDKGRDLIIEWYIDDQSIISNEQVPRRLIKVVGQCKSSDKTVGKNKVVDIRDTVETHNSFGFFLAVSTQISAPLTEKLEELKQKDIWTTWWNREDIESRLLKNQDIIPNFPKVITTKGNIRFVASN